MSPPCTVFTDTWSIPNHQVLTPDLAHNKTLKLSCKAAALENYHLGVFNDKTCTFVACQLVQARVFLFQLFLSHFVVAFVLACVMVGSKSQTKKKGCKCKARQDKALCQVVLPALNRAKNKRLLMLNILMGRVRRCRTLTTRQFHFGSFESSPNRAK